MSKPFMAEMNGEAHHQLVKRRRKRPLYNAQKRHFLRCDSQKWGLRLRIAKVFHGAILNPLPQQGRTLIE